MKKYSVYEDIASRSGGDIYVGVVGPVRTGKSTFIRNANAGDSFRKQGGARGNDGRVTAGGGR